MGKASKASEFPKTVHAYRRLAHFEMDGTGKMVEKDVEVVCCGEKIKFRANDKGHIVGVVQGPDAFNRLVKEIPEAYIEYRDGDNIPEKADPNKAPEEPEGKYVLKNGGTGETKILDDDSDEEVREFATSVGIEAEALPAALVGDDLKQAVVNLLKS